MTVQAHTASRASACCSSMASTTLSSTIRTLRGIGTPCQRWYGETEFCTLPRHAIDANAASIVRHYTFADRQADSCARDIAAVQAFEYLKNPAIVFARNTLPVVFDDEQPLTVLPLCRDMYVRSPFAAILDCIAYEILKELGQVGADDADLGKPAMRHFCIGQLNGRAEILYDRPQHLFRVATPQAAIRIIYSLRVRQQVLDEFLHLIRTFNGELEVL